MARTPSKPPRETEQRPSIPRRQPRRFWSQIMLFAAIVLLVNGLVGERGFLDSLHARRTHTAAEQGLARLRQENAALREQVWLLSSDPTTIEAVARDELGLVRRGEILVTVRDLKRNGQ